MRQALHLLSKYGGELARNDYKTLTAGRGQANAILGSERVSGFDSARASHEPFAELLSDIRHIGGRYVLGRPRMFDERLPLNWQPALEVTTWVQRRSNRDNATTIDGHN